VQLQTGDIVYDDFDDDYTRENLETRVIHLRPTEVLIPTTLTPQTEKLVKRLCPDSGIHSHYPQHTTTQHTKITITI